MQRDCGKGELVPDHYMVKWCPDSGDRERKQKIIKQSEAIQFYELVVLNPLGNARLYVCDKKGYANCIQSRYMKEDGSIEQGQNRMAELGTDT